MSGGWLPFRLVLRGGVTALVVVTPIVLLGTFAWMTNAPDAPFFDRLAELSWVGEPIDRLRDRYRPKIAAPAALTKAHAEPPLPTRPENIYIGGGAVLRDSPKSDALEVGRTSRILGLPALEHRGDWVKVQWPAAGNFAWIDLGAKREQRPPLGNEPSSPGPLPGFRAEREWLELAEGILGPGSKRGRLGPYELLHNVKSELLMERLAATVIGLEAAYAERFGVQPIDQARETIVLFQERSDYARFRDGFADLEGLASSGHAFKGMVALHAEDPDPRLVEQTLVHELTHQLNRRALGPALPAWLEEGLCEEFSEAGWAIVTGRDERDWIRSFRVTFGSRYRLSGAYSSLEAVTEATLEGDLITGQELVALDWQNFVGSMASQSSREGIGDELEDSKRHADLNYAVSGWLLRYLLSSENGHFRDDFRHYLAGVAEGEPPSGQRLVETLDLEWAELDAGFRRWILDYARDLAVPAVSPR